MEELVFHWRCKVGFGFWLANVSMQLFLVRSSRFYPSRESWQRHLRRFHHHKPIAVFMFCLPASLFTLTNVCGNCRIASIPVGNPFEMSVLAARWNYPRVNAVPASRGHCKQLKVARMALCCVFFHPTIIIHGHNNKTPPEPVLNDTRFGCNYSLPFVAGL